MRSTFGAPISRRRLFIIMVRVDVLKDELQDQQSFESFWDAKVDHAQIEPDVKWSLV